MTEIFGALLRDLRIAAGLSQNRLARLAGINPAHVNRMERPSKKGFNQPSRTVVLRLWEALEAHPVDRERLLVAAGYVPEVILLAGGWDQFLLAQRDLDGTLDRPDEAVATR